ncbi:uncharacterized protein LOC123539663 [Mercenaria mercenaria]|uniref:uncharacterized protein LOC123539663 n=1 Tax=Mercenaria mercenaria TaxID=6596 RepID=UPI00234E5ADA|nr:uncharacterized protein LOC123539663 [Mercenaria mercenaria]
MINRLSTITHITIESKTDTHTHWYDIISHLEKHYHRMSGGAWSRGPSVWATSTPQTPSLNSIMNEQQNEESTGSAGKSNHSDEKFKAQPARSEPWYPGKVNRNRNRIQKDTKDRGEPVKRKWTEPPTSASSSLSMTQRNTKSGITVVNVHKKDLNELGYKDLLEWTKHPDHLYIGRDMTLYVPGAVHSKWHNPFKSKKLGKENCCKRFKEYVQTDKTIHSNGKTLFESLEELKGKTLGCWCHPEMCHGHVLRDLVEEFCP